MDHVSPGPYIRQRGRAFCAAMLGIVAVASCGGNATAPVVSAGSATEAAAEFGLSSADLTQRVEHTEQLIASCMRGKGFEYVAVDFPAIRDAMATNKTAIGIGTDVFVIQYGFGITTQFTKPIVEFGAGPTNTAKLAALAAPDQVAYRRALWGAALDWTHARAVDAEDFALTGGCTRASADQVYTAEELSGSYVNPNDVLVERDPRMIAAIAKWSECVKAKGFVFDHPSQVEDDLQERFDAITQGQDPVALSGSGAAALKDLQAQELAVAGVSTRCEQETIEPVQALVETDIFGAPQH